MGKNLFLSYVIDENTPCYGGADGFSCRQEKSIRNDDSCNTSTWELSSHVGTHIDFPRHFYESGTTADQYEPEFWCFKKIHFEDLSLVEPGKIINQKDFHSKPSQDTELLLVKTGFFLHRDKAIYWQKNPGFHPEMADWLRAICPDLRVIGFDSISLSSFEHRKMGRKAHQAFLKPSFPILPVEDMDLSEIDSKTEILEILISPLRVSNSDASPTTVYAKVEK